MSQAKWEEVDPTSTFVTFKDITRYLSTIHCLARADEQDVRLVWGNVLTDLFNEEILSKWNRFRQGHKGPPDPLQFYLWGVDPWAKARWLQTCTTRHQPSQAAAARQEAGRRAAKEVDELARQFEHGVKIFERCGAYPVGEEVNQMEAVIWFLHFLCENGVAPGCNIVAALNLVQLYLDAIEYHQRPAAAHPVYGPHLPTTAQAKLWVRQQMLAYNRFVSGYCERRHGGPEIGKQLPFDKMMELRQQQRQQLPLDVLSDDEEEEEKDKETPETDEDEKEPSSPAQQEQGAAAAPLPQQRPILSDSGVCDSPLQLAQRFPNITRSVWFQPIYRKDTPDWRWHKWGPYVGQFDIHKMEYLYEADGKDGRPTIDAQYLFYVGRHRPKYAVAFGYPVYRFQLVQGTVAGNWQNAWTGAVTGLQQLQEYVKAQRRQDDIDDVEDDRVNECEDADLNTNDGDEAQANSALNTDD